ncbi:hypothetical protein ABZ953_28600 [Streptomyces sp. NPDC046465]|uniref:hypothetical protein n=1 Tax=Streptomyces sp. NPDC046465 TaxID=3155810 RepID=UPI0033E55F04
MPGHPEPRHITLGGHAAVALTPEEYAQLIASRRQIGGQSARVRVLAQQAKRTERLLRDLEELVGACPAERCAVGDPAAPQTACVRCTVAVLLARHRDQGR